MRHISIFYFSGTGNTWWISQKIESVFIEKGLEAETFSIEMTNVNWETKLPKILTRSDIIGIGYPVYGSSIPTNMKDWIINYLCHSLENGVEKKKAFVFDTMALFSGDTPLKMREILKNCGFLVKQAINIRMLSNVPQIPILMVWNKEKQKKILLKAQRKCEKLADRVLENKKWIMRRDPFSRLFGWLQRVGMQLEENIINKLYEIDREKCNLCELCVKHCPVDNLSIKRC